MFTKADAVQILVVYNKFLPSAMLQLYSLLRGAKSIFEREYAPGRTYIILAPVIGHGE